MKIVKIYNKAVVATVGGVLAVLAIGMPFSAHATEIQLPTGSSTVVVDSGTVVRPASYSGSSGCFVRTFSKSSDAFTGTTSISLKNVCPISDRAKVLIGTASGQTWSSCRAIAAGSSYTWKGTWSFIFSSGQQMTGTWDDC